MTELYDLAYDFATAFLKKANDSPIQVGDEARKNINHLDVPMPQHGMAAEAVITELNQWVSPATMKMGSPRFFGFVIGGAYPVSVASNWMSTAWDQNTGLEKTTPAAAVVEKISANWMLELLGLPRESACAFVTGATVANFTALAAARNQVMNQAGWDVEADGLIGAPEVQIIISADSHPTVYKSLAMLGFGRNRVTKAAVDAQGCIDMSRFPEINENAIIITQAGNINSGAFDPVAEISRLAAGKNAWIHVDGAFGLWALASNKYKHLAAGMDQADSWATDAHKWLNVPYDSGLAFVKNEHALKAAMAITASYLPSENATRNPSDYTPELSRRARGFDVYAVLRYLGKEGVAELIERCCACASRFADLFTQAGYEVMNDVVLNQVVVCFGSEALNLAVIDAVQKEGSCWVGQTSWKNRLAMRISVCNWQTELIHVDESFAIMKTMAEKVLKKA
ncbi:aminotransferase class V-fold PLP-dependent enzyme [Marinicella sp. S1101]|uniref:pyridoxal phosphate-dependent decarboxylase family protein n=1 Tax=Marinicella marina TaxID=2996016 RepID=UPI002260B282|nr:aminotransferase class V-fold PLP-dependent enzyme [Marinicella marina]MCX7554102.1 aminotransferase class V-fold PLP-dependent enzyme [Marinicella marina]MDJ1141205.1 aminotransferase class V-fold PLP-dependent enzyme [Marinicella marina]